MHELTVSTGQKWTVIYRALRFLRRNTNWTREIMNITRLSTLHRVSWYTSFHKTIVLIAVKTYCFRYLMQVKYGYFTAKTMKFFIMKDILTHFFPMLPFDSHRKHQKTKYFRVRIKGNLGKNRLSWSFFISNNLLKYMSIMES